MTAKEALREKVDQFSEEEAAEWLARIEWESSATETLSEEEFARVLAADKRTDAGEWVDGEEALSRLGRRTSFADQ